VPETRAGQLSYVLADAELRDIRVGGHLALDVVYVAVRDAEWGTVPGEILSCGTSRTRAGTTTTVEVRHSRGDIAFRWRGTIEAATDRVRFTMDGIAEQDFDTNRIGFCLLHPQALKGQPARVSGPSGEQRGIFPAEISPDPVFSGFDRMTCRVGDGAELEIRFDGELCETEDHRNWSDPGWKTYCPPLAAPRPVRFVAGQRVTRAVELRARVTADAPRRAADGHTARVRIRETVTGAFPAIGLGASCWLASDHAVRDAVRALRPSHLHVELEDGTSWAGRLETAAAEAEDLGVPLDIAIAAEPERVALIADRAARTVPRLGRMTVFSPTRHVTDGGTVSALRAALRNAGLAAPVGGGSRAHLAEFNRAVFDAGTWDFVTYGLTPQVHHTDDDSVLATVAAIADGLRQAEAIGGGLPVVVGPITLRPRFNAVGRSDPIPTGDDDGPDVDNRQHTRLAGVYLAAAAVRLIGAGALTVFRAAGRRGAVTSSGEPTPAAAVVSALTSLAGAEARATECPRSEVVAGAAAIAGGLRILVANLSPGERRLELDGAAVQDATVLAGSGLAGDALDPARLTLPPRSAVLLSAVAA
jgi:hypothetical protein